METHFAFAGRTGADVTREQLAADLKTVVHDVERLLKSTAGQLGQKASEELQSTLTRVREISSRLEVKTSEGLEAANRMVRAHPYQSIGVAFAAGLLIGVLVNRK
jgi:ElaB/YqjD/DUF883 family membrane-anchored ribosome-binding protein